MIKLIIGACLILAISACGKATNSTPEAENIVQLSTPTGCVPQSTGAFYFITQNITESADIYDCPIYPNLTCTYAKSALRAEMTCITTNLASPQSTPSGCLFKYNGTRYFLDGATLSSTATYDCGHPHGGLACDWYSHASGRGDMICVDYY